MRGLFKIGVDLDFAVIKTGGKQYKVRVGDVLKVEKLKFDEKDKTKKLEFDDLMSDKKVVGACLGDGRRKKVRVLKFHPKKRYKRVNGHRQPFSEIKIEKIG